MSTQTNTRSADEFAAELAEEVRAVYTLERRRWLHILGREEDYCPSPHWDGRRRRKDGQRSESTWVQVAKFLIEHDIRDYRAFIHALFAARPIIGKRRPLLPNQLLGPQSLEIWEDSVARNKLRARVRVEWAIEKKEFALAATDHKDYFPDADDAECLASAITGSANLSPLYRYCVAVGEGLPRIAAEFRDDALEQYILSRDIYDEVWKGWIPEQLKNAADATLLPFPE